MATTTPFLGLILPLNNEYFDTWDEPLNGNFTAVDTWAAGINTEVVAARFEFPSLSDFLSVSINPDGTLAPTQEVVNSRNSNIYGDQDPVSSVFYSLKQRLDVGDTEVWAAREGGATLRDNLAQREVRSSEILSGSANVNGYPTWLGSTGAIAAIDGSATTLAMLISGYRQRTRVLEHVTISGAAQTYYLYATYNPTGVIRVPGDANNPPPVTANGITGSDGTEIRIFSDPTVDFTTKDVEVGDVLQILGNGPNAGMYIIRVIAPGSNVNQLQIYGNFPGGALSALNYNVLDPMAPTYGFDPAVTPAEGKLYIGEVDFDGTSITATRAYAFGDDFVGEWRAVDVSGGSPTFEQIYAHNLGTDVVDVSVQVSQANDGSQPIEEMSTATITSTLGVNTTNTLAMSNDTFNPGSTNATFTNGVLSGTVSSTLTGGIQTDRAINVKWTKNTINVKNPISAVFYKDYSGTVQQTGYIRVVLSKRG